MAENDQAGESAFRRGTARTLGRIVANTVLAYASLGGALAVLLVIASTVAPAIVGDLGIRDAWVYLMLWQLLALPVVVVFVVVTDFVLRLVSRRRAASLVICVAPGVVLGSFSLVVAEFRTIAVLLIVAGVLLGTTLRVPDRTVP